MTEHFNKLTPAEAERLAMLAEEAGEIVQIVGKILRHGYESHHPLTPTVTNRQMLAVEMTDLIAVHLMMQENGDLPDILVKEALRVTEKKRRYMHHDQA